MYFVYVYYEYIIALALYVNNIVLICLMEYNMENHIENHTD